MLPGIRFFGISTVGISYHTRSGKDVIIADLNKKYQALLKKAADYYLDEDNVWDLPLKLKVRR